ncbi:MAG TPA: prolipoprotein diacylglyceryl transferase [Kineosporiaceae bacterium]|nr:prolipoprotein diacylglyceryl transferase [Kineosporiaceae bacterium]
MIRAVIPSPTQGVWHLGPLPIRAYALCIIAGIVVAVWLGDRRWRARGGRPGAVLDIAVWAVPFGIIGGRLYDIITSGWGRYYGPGGNPLEMLYIWHGGLGIWGAVALGGVGAWIGARRAGILLPPLADALAPGIVLAQAMGRWGNWFNNELHGGPTTQPWGLRVYEYDLLAGHAQLGPDGQPLVKGIFQPTFLYESLWDLGTAGVLIWLDRRYRMGHGRVFAAYVALYTAGRFWIEAMRTDPATHLLGLRINLFTSVLVFAGAVAYLVVSARRHPGRETVVHRDGGAGGADTPDAAGDGADAGGDGVVRQDGPQTADDDGDTSGGDPPGPQAADPAAADHH